MSGTKADPARLALSLDIVRVVIACLIFIHGAWRASHDGNVSGFGGWLETQGFLQGVYWAWAVTIYELVGPLLILAGRYVSLACIGHIGILGLGAYLVHFPEGWFVVGAGRNGMEYSVLLIAGLIAVSWAHAPFNQR